MRAIRRLEAAARERLDEATFGYFAGGAADELTLADNERAWDRWDLRPRVLTGCGRAEPAVELLGSRIGLPVLLAPIAAQRLLHPDGELAAARAAASAGTVFCLSTRATADLAEVARAAPGARLWFQLYAGEDRDETARILARAADHGYEAVVLTADLPVAGRREREPPGGPIALPDGVSLATHLGVPASNPDKPPAGGWRADLVPGDIARVCSASGLPVLVKGVLGPEDAALAVAHGAAGVVVSNHGGRQLDTTPATADVLAAVAGAVGGQVPVLVDGGIRSGSDVVRALALGADAALIGRPYAWALAAGGEGAVRNLLAAFAADISDTLEALGATTADGIGADHVRGCR